ncbi:hypothetical protein WMY93_005370 [Mugilogobius chulae]|uniref:KN motif and ankyrin repeat domain-containing protein 1 n=1 Tax=Mugilogobius chulae TaxID=88201 RepID=A0AAW0PZK2_9GOBI
MAQTMHFNNNGTERGQRCPSTEEDKDSVDPYYVETPYGYQLDLDFLKYVDDIERGNTIKKLSIQRKPRTPRSLALPRGSSQAEWTSTDSLSSSNSDDKQSPVSFSSRTLCPAPLTPSQSSSSEQAYGSTDHRPLLPPQSPRTTPRHNPQVEKTLMETRRRLEQERLLMQPHSEPPRRRLASFGGLGSNSSLSSYSGSIGPSHISPSTHQSLTVNGHLPNGEYNFYYPTSLGGSIRHSPLSSGMTTPVTNVSPLQLQQIREQMVIALKRLKELEEQVKTIPILQVKIAVLQEEKRQMVAQSRSQGPGGFRKRSYSVGSAEQMESPNLIQKEMELHIKEPEAPEQSRERLDEFRRLAAEVQALERTTRENKESETQPDITVQNQAHQKSIGTVTDENMNNMTNQSRTPDHSLRNVGVVTDVKKMCSAAVGVTETMLGLTSDAEKEIELQHQTIEVLKEKIYRLEVQLKETTHEMEMGKLKLELQAAGGSSKKKSDKGFMVRPEMYNACVEAKVQVRSQGVGDSLNMCSFKSAGHTVGVTCKPCVRSVAVGPDIFMERWVVHEQVPLSDQCVGREVEMCHQEVSMDRDVCEMGVNTEQSMDIETLGRTSTKECRSVGCGDCSVDVVVSPLKTLITQGTEVDLVTKIDSGMMAVPESTTCQTNTDSQGKSISTNTDAAVLVDSSTDMLLITEDKHTNTALTETRTVAVGEGLVKDLHSPPKIRSVAVGTVTDVQTFPGKSSSSKTKECGVGPLNIYENYLVGLKTRNIACGPSQPTNPEPVTSTTTEHLECVSTLSKSQEVQGLTIT